MRYSPRSLRRRRDTDKWEVALSHIDPITGERKTTYHTVVAKTEAQARKKRDQLILDLEQKGGAIATDLTVRELVDSLIAHKERTGAIEESTAHCYKKDARLICRYIGDLRVADLSIPAVEEWIAAMSNDGLAPRSIAKPFSLLKQSMKYAMAQDLVTKNPCDYCKPPRKQKKEVNFLDRDERTRMRKIVRKNLEKPICLAIELALMTGMRRGELCALRWSDIRSDGCVHVTRTLGECDGGFYEKVPKTPSSMRVIPLDRSLFRYLRAIEADRRRMAEKLSVKFGDPYVLSGTIVESKPYSPTKLSRDFKTFCEINGFDCSFHDLRHTFATMLTNAKVDPSTVASYLGHSNVATTLNVYCEPNPESKWSAVSRISEGFDIDMPYSLPSLYDRGPEDQFTIEELQEMLARKKEKERF